MQNQKMLKKPLILLATAFALPACQEGEESKKLFFTPEPIQPGTQIIQFFTPEDKSSPQNEHVVLEKDFRNNQVCLSCHQQQVERTTLPVNQKGVHEIHFSFAQIKTRCIFCHENAGKSGFPDMIGKGDRRTEYNKKCIQCHYQERDGLKTLHWEGRYK
jgi:hypothetical protein